MGCAALLLLHRASGGGGARPLGRVTEGASDKPGSSLAPSVSRYAPATSPASAVEEQKFVQLFTPRSPLVAHLSPAPEMCD